MTNTTNPQGMSSRKFEIKYFLITGLLVCSLASCTKNNPLDYADYSAKFSEGDSIEEVIEEFGEPMSVGTRQVDGKEITTYIYKNKNSNSKIISIATRDHKILWTLAEQ